MPRTYTQLGGWPRGGNEAAGRKTSEHEVPDGKFVSRLVPGGATRGVGRRPRALGGASTKDARDSTGLAEPGPAGRGSTTPVAARLDTRVPR
jgi:hypothetical protein